MEIIQHKTFEDNRGSYTPILLDIKGIDWTQCSISVNTNQFTFRGLHFQKNPSQTKYVKVIKGIIVDFMVDLETKKMDMAILSSNEAVFIPSDKAHGFLTLTPDTIVSYLVEGEYNPESEHSIVWNTIPELKEFIENIIGTSKLFISEKDEIGK
jgi:dTDP-4-dehydrorhamnose 3,5-epimerase